MNYEQLCNYVDHLCGVIERNTTGANIHSARSLTSSIGNWTDKKIRNASGAKSIIENGLPFLERVAAGENANVVYKEWRSRKS